MIICGIDNWRQKWPGLVYKYMCLSPVPYCYSLASLYHSYSLNVQAWLISGVSFHLLYRNEILRLSFTLIQPLFSLVRHILAELVSEIKYAIYKLAISAPTTLLSTLYSQRGE